MFFHDMETERLLLKCISFDDREFMLKQFSDDSVNEYLFDAEPLCSLEEADELIAFYTQPEPRGQHRWIIVDKASGKKIGTCGVHCWMREQGRVDVGYDLQPVYWGKGFMTEAMKAMLAFCESQMRVSEIDAHICVGNEKSIRLAEKLGFAFSSRTEVLSFRGKDHPHNIYTLKCGSAK